VKNHRSYSQNLRNNNRMINFLLTVDTEEEGLWGGNYKRHNEYTVDNIEYLPSFQEFCNRLGIHPTYFIDYPVVSNSNSRRVLQELLKNGNCELGAHLHPWCNPPYNEDLNFRNSYTNNLPPELQFKKLKVLTEAMVDNFGITPISYRAGRYGFDETSIPVLEELNYKIDSSVVPYRKNGIEDEPSFGLVDLNPYFLSYEDVCISGESNILEVPITVEFTRKAPDVFKKIYPSLPNLGIRRLLRTTLNLDLVWLRPSYSTVPAMIKLVDNVISNGTTVLNMMFHSTELMPGASPYNKTAEDVNNFLGKIQKIATYTKERYPANFNTLKGIPQFSREMNPTSTTSV